MSNATRTVKEFQAISIDKVEASTYQKKGTLTAQVRQVVKIISYYPAMKPTNSMTDNLFEASEFTGTEEQPFESVENRVAFFNVPSNATKEEVEKRLASNLKSCIYKVLDNHPILTTEQRSAIQAGITTKDTIANAQVVRYPENATDAGGNNIGGKIIADPNGKVQYRATYFSAIGKEDIDVRDDDMNNQYLTQEIEAELDDVFAMVDESQPADAQTI